MPNPIVPVSATLRFLSPSWGEDGTLTTLEGRINVSNSDGSVREVDVDMLTFLSPDQVGTVKQLGAVLRAVIQTQFVG